MDVNTCKGEWTIGLRMFSLSVLNFCSMFSGRLCQIGIEDFGMFRAAIPSEEQDVIYVGKEARDDFVCSEAPEELVGLVESWESRDDRNRAKASAKEVVFGLCHGSGEEVRVKTWGSQAIVLRGRWVARSASSARKDEFRNIPCSLVFRQGEVMSSFCLGRCSSV